MSPRAAGWTATAMVGSWGRPSGGPPPGRPPGRPSRAPLGGPSGAPPQAAMMRTAAARSAVAVPDRWVDLKVEVVFMMSSLSGVATLRRQSITIRRCELTKTVNVRKWFHLPAPVGSLLIRIPFGGRMDSLKPTVKSNCRTKLQVMGTRRVDPNRCAHSIRKDAKGAKVPQRN